MGKPMRPDVAAAFDRMAAVAREEAGQFPSINSAFRPDADQARLFAANLTFHLFAAPAASAVRVVPEPKHPRNSCAGAGPLPSPPVTPLDASRQDM